MTIHFTQGKLEEQERQAILEEVYTQAKAAARAAVKALVEALLEAEVTAKLGRAKGAVRHISGQPRTIDWMCGQCGCCDAQQFTRDGHYRRSLQTGWGSIEDLAVPMLECQVAYPLLRVEISKKPKRANELFVARRSWSSAHATVAPADRWRPQPHSDY